MNFAPLHQERETPCTLYARFGYQVERRVKLSPTKYFNAGLLKHTRKFAANPVYLFFAQYITEQKKVQDSLNIALKKVSGQRLTASQARNIIFSDQAYYFHEEYSRVTCLLGNFLV